MTENRRYFIKAFIPNKSYLFKTLKKRGMLDEHFDSLIFMMYDKPSVGELISLCNIKFKNDFFINSRNKYCLKIESLMYYGWGDSHCSIDIKCTIMIHDFHMNIKTYLK